LRNPPQFRVGVWLRDRRQAVIAPIRCIGLFGSHEDAAASASGLWTLIVHCPLSFAAVPDRSLRAVRP